MYGTIKKILKYIILIYSTMYLYFQVMYVDKFLFHKVDNFILDSFTINAEFYYTDGAYKYLLHFFYYYFWTA